MLMRVNHGLSSVAASDRKSEDALTHKLSCHVYICWENCQHTKAVDNKITRIPEKNTGTKLQLLLRSKASVQDLAKAFPHVCFLNTWPKLLHQFLPLEIHHSPFLDNPLEYCKHFFLDKRTEKNIKDTRNILSMKSITIYNRIDHDKKTCMGH